MESRFSYDFSRIRIHSDTNAAESAQSVKALAYTLGEDIVFGAGQYSPNTTVGTTLIAHELVHTIQQKQTPVYVQRQESDDAAQGSSQRQHVDRKTWLPIKIHVTQKMTQEEYKVAANAPGLRWRAEGPHMVQP